MAGGGNDGLKSLCKLSRNGYSFLSSVPPSFYLLDYCKDAQKGLAYWVMLQAGELLYASNTSF